MSFRRTIRLRACVVLAFAGCAKSPEPAPKPVASAPATGASGSAATPTVAKSALLVEVDILNAALEEHEQAIDLLQAGVVTTEKLVADADDDAKRTAASASISDHAKGREATLAKLLVTRTRVGELAKLPSANEAETVEARKAASMAAERIERFERDLQDQDKRMQEAAATLQSKQNDADRAEASKKLEQLKREAAEKGRKRP
ncbi:MAG: hypothetical protein SFX73_15200 [Kofleriaceae bacterium]|nr:hypothetical protein [Kofleriaceae bacterium]